VQVPHSEDIASHAVPESCVAYREVRGEALTGARTGQLLSRESVLIQGADAVSVAEGHTWRRVTASAAMTLRGLRTWHVRTLRVREPGGLASGPGAIPRVRFGKARSRSRG
jgi:hypothetical protein